MFQSLILKLPTVQCQLTNLFKPSHQHIHIYRYKYREQDIHQSWFMFIICLFYKQNQPKTLCITEKHPTFMSIKLSNHITAHPTSSNGWLMPEKAEHFIHLAASKTRTSRRSPNIDKQVHLCISPMYQFIYLLNWTSASVLLPSATAEQLITPSELVSNEAAMLTTLVTMGTGRLLSLPATIYTNTW